MLLFRVVSSRSFEGCPLCDAPEEGDPWKDRDQFAGLDENEKMSYWCPERTHYTTFVKADRLGTNTSIGMELANRCWIKVYRRHQCMQDSEESFNRIKPTHIISGFLSLNFDVRRNENECSIGETNNDPGLLGVERRLLQTTTKTLRKR